MRLVIAFVVGVVGVAGCGDDKKKGEPAPAEKAVELPALTMPALGVDSVKRMNYV